MIEWMDEANQQRTQNWIFFNRGKYERVDVMGNGPLMTRPYWQPSLLGRTGEGRSGRS